MTMLGLTHPGAAELAARPRAARAEGPDARLLPDAGATAVEIALKIAFQACQLRGERSARASRRWSRRTTATPSGAIAVGYSETFHRFYRPLLFDVLRLTPPHLFRWRDGMTEGRVRSRDRRCALALRIGRARGADRRAAGAGAAGMWMHPPRYLADSRSSRARPARC